MSLDGIRLVVAYDGAGFAGFASQPRERTVQRTLACAIEGMNGAPVAVRAASRTDAGVHAEGQVVAFDPARRIPTEGWVAGLNGALPQDIAVMSAAACEPGYDPRHDALNKHYRYLVHVGSTRHPLLRHDAWHLPRGMTSDRGRGADVDGWLDVEAMAHSASRLEGTHDFRAFRAADDPREGTVRTLMSVTVTPGHRLRRDLLSIEVQGTAFLKYMVRIIAGTLVEVGRGRMTSENVRALLGAGGGRQDAGPTAPAHGLTLLDITLGRLGTRPGASR